MPARLPVFWAFLSIVVLSYLVPGTHAQVPGNPREQYCGHTSCRELGRMLTTAVTTAEHQFEDSRSGLHPHEVHLSGPFSRFFAYIEGILDRGKAAEEENKKVPRKVGSTGSPTKKATDNDIVMVYNAHEVERLSFSTKKTLVKGLKTSRDFQPLLTSIEKQFPDTPPSFLIRGVSYIKEDSGDGWLERVSSFLTALLDNGPGPITLHFTSTPVSGAKIVIKVFETDPKTHTWMTNETVTDGPIPDLARGAYLYNVAGNDFKSGDGWLDVKGKKREYKVLCHLEPPNSSLTSTCVFKED